MQPDQADVSGGPSASSSPSFTTSAPVSYTTKMPEIGMEGDQRSDGSQKSQKKYKSDNSVHFSNSQSTIDTMKMFSKRNSSNYVCKSVGTASEICAVGTATSASTDLSAKSTDDDTQRFKHQKRKEQNRKAAQINRGRKKMLVDELQRCVSTFQQSNTSLRLHNTKLSDLVQQVKLVLPETLSPLEAEALFNEDALENRCDGEICAGSDFGVDLESTSDGMRKVNEKDSIIFGGLNLPPVGASMEAMMNFQTAVSANLQLAVHGKTHPEVITASTSSSHQNERLADGQTKKCRSKVVKNQERDKSGSASTISENASHSGNNDSHQLISHIPMPINLPDRNHAAQVNAVFSSFAAQEAPSNSSSNMLENEDSVRLRYNTALYDSPQSRHIFRLQQEPLAFLLARANASNYVHSSHFQENTAPSIPNTPFDSQYMQQMLAQQYLQASASLLQSRWGFGSEIDSSLRQPIHNTTGAEVARCNFALQQLQQQQQDVVFQHQLQQQNQHLMQQHQQQSENQDLPELCSQQFKQTLQQLQHQEQRRRNP